jgi:hypothetical protein
LNAKRSGGMGHNPLLVRTEPEQDTRPPAGLPASTPVHTPSMAPTDQQGPSSDRASKFTFYFTADQLDRLDDVWEQMRKRQRRGRRPSKSRFVRVALDRLLDDFAHNPDTVMALLVEE